MLKGELTLDQAKALVKRGRIVYVVVNQSNEIVKIFDYHVEAFNYATEDGLWSYNITHPKCPRFVKFELEYIQQLDLFLDFSEKP